MLSLSKDNGRLTKQQYSHDQKEATEGEEQ